MGCATPPGGVDPPGGPDGGAEGAAEGGAAGGPEGAGCAEGCDTARKLLKVRSASSVFFTITLFILRFCFNEVVDIECGCLV